MKSENSEKAKVTKSIRVNFQQAEDLLDFYIEAYTEKFKRKPQVNYSKDKFKLVDILKTELFHEILKNIKYYIQIEQSPNIDDFAFNYHEVSSLKIKVDADKLERARVREKTRKKVSEFKKEKK